MYLRDENGEFLLDAAGKKCWIDNALAENLGFVSKKVQHKIPHRRSDLFVICDGPVGCLPGEVKIRMKRNTEINNIPIEDLYKRFKKKTTRYAFKKKIQTKVMSFDGEELVWHPIKDVVYSGKKIVYEIKLKNGKKIRATANHKILTSLGFVKLIELTPVHSVMYYFHGGTPHYSRVVARKKHFEEDTYDIVCEDPHHNFVANDIVVHNSGKTTLSFQVCRLLDPTFNLSRVVFSVDEFLRALIAAKPGQAVVFDEAIIVNSRSALTDFNKKVIIAMTQIRSKGLYIFFNIPSIFDLDKNLVLNRCHLLLHCYQDKFGDRGRYTVFDKDKLKLLYLKGKRLYSYGFPKSNFVGNFTEYFPLDRISYEEKKQKSIAEQANVKQKMDFELRQLRVIEWFRRNQEVLFPGKDKKYLYEKLCNILDYGYETFSDQITKINNMDSENWKFTNKLALRNFKYLEDSDKYTFYPNTY